MKKQLLATLLASVAGSSFALAPTAALNHDPATYRNVTQKAAADYKSAVAKCAGMSGNEKEVCVAEAKAARAHADADAVAQYNNSVKGRQMARSKLADADFSLAKARCDAKSGAEKDDCVNAAKSVHTAALADARADRNTTTTTAGAGSEMAQRTENAAEKTKVAAMNAAEKTKELAKSAVEKTKEVASTVAQKTENAMDRAGEKTRETASTATRKTEHAMDRAEDKTRDTASTAAHKTENAMDKAGEKTRDTASTVAERTEHGTEHATAKTERVASDSAITTKVKAFMFTEPDLRSLSIHVKTEQGVVMLSGFVGTKAEADKAVEVAQKVDGVTTVKSAIRVK